MLDQSNPSGQPTGLHPATFPAGKPACVEVAHCRICGSPDFIPDGAATADVSHDEDARNRVSDDQIAILAVLASDPLE